MIPSVPTMLWFILAVLGLFGIIACHIRARQAPTARQRFRALQLLGIELLCLSLANILRDLRYSAWLALPPTIWSWTADGLFLVGIVAVIWAAYLIASASATAEGSRESE